MGQNASITSKKAVSVVGCCFFIIYNRVGGSD